MSSILSVSGFASSPMIKIFTLIASSVPTCAQSNGNLRITEALQGLRVAAMRASFGIFRREFWEIISIGLEIPSSWTGTEQYLLRHVVRVRLVPDFEWHLSVVQNPVALRCKAACVSHHPNMYVSCISRPKKFPVLQTCHPSVHVPSDA